MTDQEKREKVIKGPECCLGSDSCAKCNFFEYKMDCSWHLKYEALELLKEQEPRVMTLEDVRQFVYGSPYIIETNLPGDEPRLMWGLYSHQGIGGNFDFAITDGRKRLFDVDYGTIWRCWTSRPTDEQRRAVKWE